MQQLKEHTFSRQGGTGESKHDWAKLLDGGIYSLEKGEGKDYDCETKTFAMMARKQAGKKGLSVKTETTDTGVILQAIPLTDKAKAAKAAKEAAGAATTGATPPATPAPAAKTQPAAPAKGGTPPAKAGGKK